MSLHLQYHYLPHYSNKSPSCLLLSSHFICYSIYSYFADWRKRRFGSPRDLFWQIDSISHLEGNARKRVLCNEVMEHMIREEKGDDFVEFEKRKSDLPVARMVSRWMPLSFSNRRIDRYDYYKPMVWCKPRRYKKRVGGQIVSDQIKGVYLAGSTKNDHKVFVLRPASLEAKVVIPVEQLNGYYYRKPTKWRSSSSTEEDPERIARTVRPGTPSPERESTANQTMLNASLGNQGTSSGNRGATPWNRSYLPGNQGTSSWNQGAAQGIRGVTPGNPVATPGNQGTSSSVESSTAESSSEESSSEESSSEKSSSEE